MQPTGRLALSVLLTLLCLAACGGEVTGPSPAPAEETTGMVEAAAGGGPRFRTAAECGACHEEIYAEWQASMHAKAMSDFLFLYLPAENREECIRCHAPVPLRDVDFDVPVARLDRREDAVSCLTCHQMGDQIAAPHEGVEGPCNPVYDAAQTDARKMCFGCHDQHGTGKEWLNGPYGPHAPEPRQRDMTTCLDCHMPVVERPVVKGGPVRKGRRHTWPGGHVLEHLQKAAELDVEVEKLPEGGHRFRVWVTNVGAGHNIPTDARHRSFDTYVKLWDANGKLILDPTAEVAPGEIDIDQQERAHAATYRLYYRNSGIRDTQIAPLERVSTLHKQLGYVDVPEARKGRGEAWLVYRLVPEDALVKESVEKPEEFRHLRARVVTRVEFEFGE